MSALRDQAIAAAEAAAAAEQQRVLDADREFRRQARAALQVVLDRQAVGAPIDVAALTVAEYQRDERRVVVTDGTVHLAVVDRKRDAAAPQFMVLLVVPDGAGGWEQRSGPLSSLADLGRVLIDGNRP